MQGRSIADLAKEAGKPPIDLVLDLLAETGGYVSAVNFCINEQDIAEVMQYPWTSIGSDAVGTHPSEIATKDQIHPRTYGTFPRVLGRYVRDLGVLTEAQAIQKMTSLPAERMQLTGRGRIAPGYYADVTIYDPTTIRDIATFDRPHQYGTGIITVLVNGRIAHAQSQPNGTLAGKILRHT